MVDHSADFGDSMERRGTRRSWPGQLTAGTNVTLQIQRSCDKRLLIHSCGIHVSGS